MQNVKRSSYFEFYQLTTQLITLSTDFLIVWILAKY